MGRGGSCERRGEQSACQALRRRILAYSRVPRARLLLTAAAEKPGLVDPSEGGGRHRGKPEPPPARASFVWWLATSK